ncbi:hypothetical protein [Kaistia adipata]|uniref:hypothetical protein n=1 Tax=Kaistia adipata TaxID=166954 RepID=UPI00048A6169|nr:hypothetical protein [Kaistia adipata]
MPSTARYIQELTDQLSQLASQDGMRDLAYLLKLASQEAQTMVETPPAPPAPQAPSDDHG